MKPKPLLAATLALLASCASQPTVSSEDASLKSGDKGFQTTALADGLQPAVTVRYGQRWKTVQIAQGPGRLEAVQDVESHRLDIGVRVNAGYYADPKGFDGLAHLAEHMTVESAPPPYAESLHDWVRLSQSRQLHCQTFELHTSCFISVDISEAREAMARVTAAFAPRTFPSSDVDRQLEDISQEFERFTSTESGTVTAFEGGLANPEHPESRTFSSGGAEALKRAPRGALNVAAQDFLSDNYWSHPAEIVLISPWPFARVLEFARGYLKVGGNVGRSMPMSSSSPVVPPFDQSQIDADHESTRSATDDLVIVNFVLPMPTVANPLSADRFRAFDLLQFNLQALGPDSLQTDLARRFGVHSIWVNAAPGRYGNADVLRLELERGGPTELHSHELRMALSQFFHVLDLRSRSVTVRRYVLEAGRAGLTASEPDRDALVFDALEELHTGRDAGAFDYRLDVGDGAWQAYKSILSVLQTQTPLQMSFRGPASVARTAAIAPPTPRTQAREIPEATEQQIGGAAACIAAGETKERLCVSGLWSVAGLRGVRPFENATQRTLAAALLEQTRQALVESVPALLDSGTTFEVVAGVSPAFGIVGGTRESHAVLQQAWKEFLRVRTDTELGAIHNALAFEPDNAFDWSIEAAQGGLAVTAHDAARKLSPEVELKQAINELQRAYRNTSVERYTMSGGTAPKTQSVKSGSTSPAVKIVAPMSKSPGTLLQMRCAQPTDGLLAYLRLMALPYHKYFLNAGRASGDRSAFGAYLTREWGQFKCYGPSMDSGVLDREALRSHVSDLWREGNRHFCEMGPEDWGDMRSGVLISEGLSWANDQAYAVEDLRNWMRYGPGIAPARSIAKRAAAITQAQVCNWPGAHGSKDGAPVWTVVVEVPLTH